MSFVFFTSIEILFAILLMIEIKNKKKLIEFEDLIIKAIRRKIRKTKTTKNSQKSQIIQLNNFKKSA